jgi:hypothetical protein
MTLARIKRGVQGAILALCALYLGDYLSARFRIPHNRNPFGSVQVERYYAVRLKDGKIEYMPDDPEIDTCVYSIFPQLGYTPCWYLNRHKRKQIDIGRVSPDLPDQPFFRAALWCYRL